MDNLQTQIKNIDLETPSVFKRLALAHRYLGELKGACASIPNQEILISTLILQESQQSSAIENVVTTQDELYASQDTPERADPATKEVIRYKEALYKGFEMVKRDKSLTLDTVNEIQGVLLPDKRGFRQKSGTIIKNSATGKVIYRPPAPEKMQTLLADWEKYLVKKNQLDPLVNMALIHHQFESIHPFHDGNGRTGRIINILHLIMEDLMESPILYLSRYINQTKQEYYRLLQAVRDEARWEEWVVYILDGVCLTAKSTLLLVKEIKNLLQEMKEAIRSDHPKMYSQDLLNNLFIHPYTKINHLAADIRVSRDTATRYLATLVKGGHLVKETIGRENYYLNFKLVDLLFNVPDLDFEMLEPAN